MAVLLEGDRRICYHFTHLALLCGIFLAFSTVTPTHGYKFLNLRGLTKSKYNSTIEIAVVVPEYDLPRNQCCPANEVTCGRKGTQCQCQQNGINCVCVCPTANFPDGFHFNKDNCCPSNNTYCKRFGDDCDCEQDETGCRCVCPAELDYTVRWAAGIAIVLLIGVTVLLVISLYRRAASSRRRRRAEGSSSSSSSSSEGSDPSTPEPPPNYADVYLISTPKVVDSESIDFEKLPSYEEALFLQACIRSGAQAQNSSDTKIVEGVNMTVILAEQQVDHIGDPLDSTEIEITAL